MFFANQYNVMNKLQTFQFHPRIQSTIQNNLVSYVDLFEDNIDRDSQNIVPFEFDRALLHSKMILKYSKNLKFSKSRFFEKP